MAEYINKAELMNERPEWLNTNTWNKEKSAHNNGWNDCNDEWLNIITEISTIDIVQCEFCKYGKHEKSSISHIVCGRDQYIRRYDWFCADGEMRTDDNNRY